MKISILVPIYGVEKYIEECAISLFEQNYDDIEYVFVDDCSEDKSIDLLKRVITRYPHRKNQCRIVKHEHNRGLAAARNTGVENATGDYLMHVDSDDRIPSNCIYTLTKDLKEKGSVDILVFGSNNLCKNSQKENAFTFPVDKEKYIEGILKKTNSPSIWAKLYNTKFYKDSGIRSVEGLNYSEDLAVVPRLLTKAKTIRGINKPLYDYRTNQSSYTNSLKPVYIEDIVKTDRILKDFFLKESIGITSDIIDLMMLRTKSGLAKRIFKSGDYSLYPNIQKIYEELNDKLYLLPFYDKIIIRLLNAGQYKLLNGFMIIWKLSINVRNSVRRKL